MRVPDGLNRAHVEKRKRLCFSLISLQLALLGLRLLKAADSGILLPFFLFPLILFCLKSLPPWESRGLCQWPRGSVRWGLCHCLYSVRSGGTKQLFARAGVLDAVRQCGWSLFCMFSQSSRSSPWATSARLRVPSVCMDHVYVRGQS